MVSQGAVSQAREAVKRLLVDTATAYSYPKTRTSGGTNTPTPVNEGQRKCLKSTRLERPVRDIVAGMEMTGVAWQVKLAHDAVIEPGWDLHFEDGLRLHVEAVLDQRTNQLLTVAVCRERQA